MDLYLQWMPLRSEDELVSLDELQEKVAEFDEYVQSSDVAAMQSMCYYLFALLFLAHTFPRRALDGLFLVSFGVFDWMYWCDVSTAESSNPSCCNQLLECSVALIPLLLDCDLCCCTQQRV